MIGLILEAAPSDGDDGEDDEVREVYGACGVALELANFCSLNAGDAAVFCT